MSAKEIFEVNIELSEDEVVMLIHTEGELSIKECQSEYHRLATEAGLIKSPAKRKAEWEDKVEEFDISTEDGVAEARNIGAELDITSVTVNRYLKALATELNITLPVTAPRGNLTWPKVIEAFDAEEALNGGREEVIAKINTVGEYDDIKKSSSYYNKLKKHFGWEAPASMSSQLCDWFKEMYLSDVDINKAAIIEKSLEIGMTEGSGVYYVGVFKLTNEILESIK